MLDGVLLNLQARLLFLSIFQWLQFGFHISTSIALVMHNIKWIYTNIEILYQYKTTQIYTNIEILYQLVS
jgi:hypothetical protein